MAELYDYFSLIFYGEDYLFQGELLSVLYCSFVLIFGVFGILMLLKFVFNFFRG